MMNFLLARRTLEKDWEEEGLERAREEGENGRIRVTRKPRVRLQRDQGPSRS